MPVEIPPYTNENKVIKTIGNKKDSARPFLSLKACNKSLYTISLIIIHVGFFLLILKKSSQGLLFLLQLIQSLPPVYQINLIG